jgi:lipooligosaccharide transport system permease protein
MSTQVITPRPSTGRSLGSVRAVLLVVEGMWTWYRRNWRASVASSFLNPVLFLVAMGFGLGSQVTPSAATDGLRYVEYLAPAMLVMALVQNAVFESTYPVLSSFKWQRTYWAMTASPITPGQVLGGQLAWVAVRMLLSGVAFLVVAAALGAVTGFGVLLSLVFAVLAAMATCAPVVAFSATIESEGQQFNALFRFVLMPMTLLAGTFFPVSQLPEWLRPLAWLTPLWHGTELARAAAFGALRLWPVLGHVGYLLAMLAVGALIARRLFERRLAR